MRRFIILAIRTLINDIKAMIGCMCKYPFCVTVKIILNYLFFTLLSFLIPDRYFLTNYCGGKIFLNLRESRMMRARALGVYEYWKTKLFTKLIKPNMTVLDIGAHNGYFSLLAAKLMEDKGRVFTFEPEPKNYYWLQKNIEVNRYRCIKPFKIALSDNDGEATLFLGEKSGYHSLIPLSLIKDTMMVKTLRLDTFLRQENISEVDLIKIDVEGAEFLVLKGGKDFLRKSQKVKIIIDIHSRSMGRKIYDFLLKYEFKIYNINKRLFPVKVITQISEVIYATK